MSEILQGWNRLHGGGGLVFCTFGWAIFAWMQNSFIFLNSLTTELERQDETMSKRNVLAFLLAVGMLLGLLAGCSSGDTGDSTTAATTTPATTGAAIQAPTEEAPSDHYPVTITTYNYNKEEVQVTFDSCPQRVVCTNQSQTELLLYFGLDEHIAGVAYLDGAIREDLQAQYDALVADGKELTVKGYPSKEVVLALEPDFIFGWRSAFAEDALGDVSEWTQMGVGTMILRCSNNTVDERNLDAVLADIADIGAIFDIEDQTDAYIAQAHDLIDEVEAKVATLESPLTVIVVEPGNDGSWYCWGSNTLTGSLAISAGGEYACPDGGTLSVEDLINLNPDAIIVDYMEKEGVSTQECEAEAIATLTSVEALAEVTAVANGKIMAVNLTDVYGGGIRMVPSVEAMFNFLYGD